MKQLVLAVAIAFIMLSCKKESTPAFSPVGEWRGNANVYSVLLLNKENGKSRIYIGTLYADTAQAGYKWDGTYSKENKGYEFRFYDDTVLIAVLKPDQLKFEQMSGTAFIQQAALEFNLRKQ